MILILLDNVKNYWRSDCTFITACIVSSEGSFGAVCDHFSGS